MLLQHCNQQCFDWTCTGHGDCWSGRQATACNRTSLRCNAGIVCQTNNFTVRQHETAPCTLFLLCMKQLLSCVDDMASHFLMIYHAVVLIYLGSRSPSDGPELISCHMTATLASSCVSRLLVVLQAEKLPMVSSSGSVQAAAASMEHISQAGICRILTWRLLDRHWQWHATGNSACYC